MTFTDYAEKALKKLPNTKSAYLYKQEVIAKMTARANELVESGLSDGKVINELVISEFSDIEKEYYSKRENKNKKAKAKKMGSFALLGVAGYALVLLVLYLSVSFMTSLWGKTWLILVGGILIPVAAGMFAAAVGAGGKKTILNFASRILVSCSVFIIATVVFLAAVVFNLFSHSWLIFIFAVIASLVIDCILAFAYKQKSAIVSLILYIPAVSALSYVALGISGILSWKFGWIIIVLSLVLDIGIIAARIATSSKKEAEDEIWEDD